MAHLSWIYPLKMVIFHSYVSWPEGNPGWIELDDGKFLTRKPIKFDGKKPMGFRLRFSQQNQSNEPQQVRNTVMNKNTLW